MTKFLKFQYRGSDARKLLQEKIAKQGLMEARGSELDLKNSHHRDRQAGRTGPIRDSGQGRGRCAQEQRTDQYGRLGRGSAWGPSQMPRVLGISREGTNHTDDGGGQTQRTNMGSNGRKGWGGGCTGTPRLTYLHDYVH